MKHGRVNSTCILVVSPPLQTAHSYLCVYRKQTCRVRTCSWGPRYWWPLLLAKFRKRKRINDMNQYSYSWWLDREWVLIDRTGCRGRASWAGGGRRRADGASAAGWSDDDGAASAAGVVRPARLLPAGAGEHAGRHLCCVVVVVAAAAAPAGPGAPPPAADRPPPRLLPHQGRLRRRQQRLHLRLVHACTKLLAPGDHQCSFVHD